MKQIARGLFAVIALCIGALAAAYFLPAPWVARFANAHGGEHVLLMRATGTLGHGGATLHVPVAGINAPMQWRYQFPLAIEVSIGGGVLHLSPNNATLSRPAQVAFQHAMARGSASVNQFSAQREREGAWRVHGEAAATTLNLDLVGTPATLTNVQLKLQNTGAFTLTAEGDIAVKFQGQLAPLPPLRGEVSGTLKPATNAPALERLLRSAFAPNGDGGFSVSRRFP